MKISVEDINTTRKVINIDVPAEDVENKLALAYRELNQKSKIKGFRPGKTPRSVLERLYGKQVKSDLSAELVQEGARQVMDGKSWQVIGTPDINKPPLSGGQPYQFSITIDIMPEIGDFEYRGLKLKKNLYPVSDELITGQIERFQKKLAKLDPITPERPLQPNDWAVIDYQVFQDGQPFADIQPTTDFSLQIGQAAIDQTFDDQLIGMAPGQSKDVTVTFAEAHENPSLAGQTITFGVTLKEIRTEILPEINDEMAKQLGNFETLAQLRTHIREDLEARYANRSDQEVYESVFQLLLAQTEFELPETFVEQENAAILQDFENRLAGQNISIEQIGFDRATLALRYRPLAEKQVRRKMVLGKIIEQAQLTVNDETMALYFNQIAADKKQSVDEIKKFYQEHPQQLDFFKQTLLEKQAMALILESSHIEEVTAEPQAVQQP